MKYDLFWWCLMFWWCLTIIKASLIGSVGKESTCSEPGLGRYPGEGKGILAWRIPGTV